MGLKKFMQVDIDKLKKANWNYKRDNDKLLEKLKANIKNNGLVINLIVRELTDGTYEVINGNHRLDACKELGINSVNVYNLGKIDEITAKRIAVETNETNFETDINKLSDLVKELTNMFGDDELKLTMPFEDFELEALTKTGDFSFDDIDLTNIDSETETQSDNKVSGIVCPHCGGLN